jgi:hypothetical protein
MKFSMTGQVKANRLIQYGVWVGLTVLKNEGSMTTTRYLHCLTTLNENLTNIH